MAARLETIIKKWTGYSTEDKPQHCRLASASLMGPGDGRTSDENNIPPGSIFFEQDTGDTYYWSGIAWEKGEAETAMMSELRSQSQLQAETNRLLGILLQKF